MTTLYSPKEIFLRIASNVKHQRLNRNMSQEELSSRSGVPLGTIRVFEQKGMISLVNLVKVAIALGEEEALVRLFEPGEVRTLFGFEKKLKDRVRATGRRRGKDV